MRLGRSGSIGTKIAYNKSDEIRQHLGEDGAPSGFKGGEYKPLLQIFFLGTEHSFLSRHHFGLLLLCKKIILHLDQLLILT